MWYPTDHMLGLRRNGVNHVGLENPFRHNGFSEPVEGTTYPVTTVALLDKYAVDPVGLRLRSARVVFSWESVQKNPDPLPQPFAAAAMGAVPDNVGGFGTYWSNLVRLVIRLIDRGIYVTVVPWQYNKNANSGAGDTDITYNDKSFEAEHFADFWGKFATAINQAVMTGLPPDPEFPAHPGRRDRLAFDLINEPHEPRPTDGTVGITLAKWQTCAQAAIQAIRANPANTNTIFVEGLGYASPNRDTQLLNPADPDSIFWNVVRPSDPLNKIAISAHCYNATRVMVGETPSQKPTDALRVACKDLVDSARKHGFKVHIGEVAVDAGVGGCSDFATAQNQWADWGKFCLENDDVIVGWNWWGNTSSTWGWSEEGSCKFGDANADGPRTWALTQDDGAKWGTPTEDTHVKLIKGSIPVPELVIRDNLGDDGTEPNPTAAHLWESPDIWVRKTADGDVFDADEQVKGATSCFVYVRVTNRGEGAYPSDGNDVVALYWAKADSALAVPEPWNGKKNGVVVTNPMPGGLVGSVPIGALAAKTSKRIAITWPTTPDPDAYPVKDGHFCLLAVIAKDFNALADVSYEGLDPPDLMGGVRRLNNVAWHNIHIASPAVGGGAGGMMKLGAAVLANHTDRPMRAKLALELLDAWARPVDPRPGRLSVTLLGPALETIRLFEAGGSWEYMGDGTFGVLDPSTATPELPLQPGEALPFVLSYTPDRRGGGYAVRALQYARAGGSTRLVGGQTFVVGEVEGFTSRRSERRKGSIWPWVIASGTLLLLGTVLVQRAKSGRSPRSTFEKGGRRSRPHGR